MFIFNLPKLNESNKLLVLTLDPFVVFISDVRLFNGCIGWLFKSKPP